jgi:type III secretory pathway component EscT
MSENVNEKKNVSRHILPTSANLLGLCFVILSFIKFWCRGRIETIIDELLGIAVMLFLVSSILSYASMRSKGKTEYFEKMADIIFLCGLVFLSLISVILVFEVIY